jgi:NADPH2 dehydrogenase
MTHQYPRIAQLKTAAQFRHHIESLGIHLPFDETIDSWEDNPLGQTCVLKNGRQIGNRFAIQPMEGWDGTTNGMPSERTVRRWANFGRSGAKLIWGGEAVAVRHDGRANPNQLFINDENMTGLDRLRNTLIDAHITATGSVDGLFIGLQLTHSGRFARPNLRTRLEPKILYHHPLLDKLYKIDPELPVMTDTQIAELVEDYVRAAKQSYELGFDFVDIKHSHGYLGHEFLSAYSRPGRYGGSFENRTRFLREVVEGIRQVAPELVIGVRLSMIDFPPFRETEPGISKPVRYNENDDSYPFAFGGDPNNLHQVDLTEPVRFLELLRSLGIELVNLSAGSPYYNPHITRPALFPPSDGYAPPEDPLVGVARHINTTAALKSRFPDMMLVGSGYSYLQDWLPNVAQHVVRSGMVDFVALGRMVLSYPEMPADIMRSKAPDRKRICRTFSDCTTGPRNGMISGCFPLDDYYKVLPEAERVREIKRKAKLADSASGS